MVPPVVGVPASVPGVATVSLDTAVSALLLESLPQALAMSDADSAKPSKPMIRRFIATP